MSDLSLGPTPERSRIPSILIAAMALAIVAAVIYHFSPRTPAHISVVKVDLFGPHTETKAAKGGVHVLGTPASFEDNLYVVVHLRLTNQLRRPIYLESPIATLTLPESSTPATVVSPADAGRLEQSFPALTTFATSPIGSNTDIAPGATVEGSIILLFPTLTEAVWKSKKSASLTVNLHNLPPQSIALP